MHYSDPFSKDEKMNRFIYQLLYNIFLAKIIIILTFFSPYFIQTFSKFSFPSECNYSIVVLFKVSIEFSELLSCRRRLRFVSVLPFYTCTNSHYHSLSPQFFIFNPWKFITHLDPFKWLLSISSVLWMSKLNSRMKWFYFFLFLDYSLLSWKIV